MPGASQWGLEIQVTHSDTNIYEAESKTPPNNVASSVAPFTLSHQAKGNIFLKLEDNFIKI